MDNLHLYWVEILEGKKIRASELINESHALLLSVRMVLAILDGASKKVTENQKMHNINCFQIKLLDQEQPRRLAENLKSALEKLDFRILGFLPTVQRALDSASYFNNNSADDKLSSALTNLIRELEKSMITLNHLLEKK